MVGDNLTGLPNNGNDVNIINGAGLSLTRGRIHLLNNLISHNTATSDGGGLSIWQAKVVISGNTIVHNVASTNTIYGDGAGIHANASGVTLTNNIIAYNHALGSQSQGGGVNFYQSTPELVQGNLIMFNESGYGGGMAYSVASMLSMTTGNVIVNNTALNDGGGVRFAFINNSEDLTFTHNSVYGNSANGVANDVGTADNSDREDINAIENWWGTTNLATIESHIFHAVDDANRALVLFQPILTSSPSSEQTISTTGGTFNSGDGVVSLTVPANATTESVTIHYGRLFTPTTTLPNNSNFALGFNLFALKADGTAVTQFAQPLTLTINYPSDTELSNMGIDENDLTLSYWNGSQWQSAYPCTGCSINTSQNRITVLLDHFTEFALIAEIPEYPVFLPMIVR